MLFYAHSIINSRIKILLTHEQSILIQAKYDFFLAAYQKELDLFFYAFVGKNNLNLKNAKSGCAVTKEDNERIKAIEKMKDAISKVQFHKQIN